MPKADTLAKLNIIVIGAGPAGLVFARAAHEQGATVRVIERAGDPRVDDAGYTNRSFNLTINSIGRKVLGDPEVLAGSTDVIGRAVHSFQGTNDTKLADFDKTELALLTSIPRPVLRQNLADLAEKEGLEISFHTKVTNLEPSAGKVFTEVNGEPQELSADLVVIADGIHSVADTFIENMPGGSLNMRIEPLNYVTVLLDKETCRDLSLHHIHFWLRPDQGSVAIGLPNKDGTIAALLISRYDDVASDESPFATLEQATERLQIGFPELLKLEPSLAAKVVGQKRGRFHYKSITHHVLSDRCVVIGDAGSATPPWAGFGANTAMYSADALVRFITGMNGDVSKALLAYQTHKRILSELVSEYAGLHGEFLSKKVADNPEDRQIGPVLTRLVREAIDKTDIPAGVELLDL